jgi:hypothetical protein
LATIEKFVKNYELINKPLTEQLKKNAFNWSPEAEQTFECLKEAMTIVPVLVMLDFNETFCIGNRCQWQGHWCYIKAK